MATTYKLIRDKEGTVTGAVERNIDGVLSAIPLNTANRDYQAYLDWVAAGNTVTPADAAKSAGDLLTEQRADAVTQSAAATSNATLIRAVLLVALNEINTLRQRDVDRSADVAAASSLANLQTRWAARSALADRTAAQLKTAISTIINAGTAD